MENIKYSRFIPTLEIPSKYSIFKRMANLVLVLIGVVICINLWLISSEQSANWHNKQANQLGRSLTSLSANTLADDILAGESQKLAQQLQLITADRHVLSASLFDNKGRQLADNNTPSSVVASFKLNSNKPLVFVEPIKRQDQLVGYLRVMLEEKKVMEYHSEYQLQLYQQLTVLMMLAAAVGILVARAFYKFRYRSKKQSSLSQQKKSPSA